MVPLKIKLPENYLEEEVRDGFTVTKEIKELFAVLLDILVQIQQLCEKHNIEYFADSGTLLGAVRHKGFIPWDDDIDLMMTRKNFEKFAAAAKKELKAPYFYQDEENEHGSLRLCGKVFNADTTAILKSEQHRNFKFCQGIFVDIFCFDNLPDSQEEKDQFIKDTDELRKKSKKLNNLTYRYNPELDSVSIKKNLKTVFSSVYKFLHLPNFYYNKLVKVCKKYNEKEPLEFGSFMYKDYREPPQFRKEYETCHKVPFEFIEIIIPDGYENILNRQYGQWKEFVKGGSDHGNLILDTDKSYKFYLNK